MLDNYYENKAKDSKELIILSCKVLAVVAVVAACVAGLKWLLTS